MGNAHSIDGLAIEVTQPDFAMGGQGVLHRARHSASNTALALKSVPASRMSALRTQALVDLRLWQQSPLLASPFAMEERQGQVQHLASFIDAPDLLSAPVRDFREQLEWAFLLCCLWCQLEGRGVAHGDIAPSNVLISSSGEPHLIDFDNAVIKASKVKASMRGQRMMLAPELRRDGSPDVTSDRFAWAVLLNICLLRRHPADGLTRRLADMDRIMSEGRWPERVRSPLDGEIPWQILGDALPLLFDRAFALDPSKRPSAREWQKGLRDALKALVVHDCGGLFVPQKQLHTCLYCGQAVGKDLSARPKTLIAKIIGAEHSVRASLDQGNALILGRENLRGSRKLSREQLSLTLHGSRLLLRQLGCNPSGLYRANGRLEVIQTRWVDLPPKDVPIRLQLADAQVELTVA